MELNFKSKSAIQGKDTQPGLELVFESKGTIKKRRTVNRAAVRERKESSKVRAEKLAYFWREMGDEQKAKDVEAFQSWLDGPADFKNPAHLKIMGVDF